MTIYNIEENLLNFLRVRQHTQLTERDITDALHISHGTFSAVRKRLIDAGALKCARVGRKLLFEVLEGAAVPAPPHHTESAASAAPPPNMEAGNGIAPAAPDVTSGVQEPPPRVCGWFPSVDDWVSILMQRLGDVAADQIDDEEYSVVLMTDFTEQRYTVKESAGGIEVS